MLIMLDRLNSVFTGSTTAPRKSPADMYLHLLLQAGTQLLKTLDHGNATTGYPIFHTQNPSF